MKKGIAVLMAVLLLSVVALSGCGDKNAVTINVYNWGQYISTGEEEDTLDVIKEFTKRTGIKVKYSNYESNETMYSKMVSGAGDYDVIIPSDYMISKMIEEDMLAELDFSNIPNYSKIGDAYKNLEFDPQNKYSVPYTWGTVVIMYNKTKVDAADVEQQSWDILWNEKYKGNILMFDNPRDAFGIALKKLGKSQNSVTPEDWKQAAEELKKQKPLVQAYVMDQIFDKMGSGEAILAPYYGGDSVIMRQDNPDIGCIIPKEGTNMFVDSMCVPKTSTHKKEAEQFINFMCETDIALSNAKAIGYATPQTEAKAQLSKELTSDPYIYPSEDVLKNTEVFKNLPANINKLESELWIEVKK